MKRMLCLCLTLILTAGCAQTDGTESGDAWHRTETLPVLTEVPVPNDELLPLQAYMEPRIGEVENMLDISFVNNFYLYDAVATPTGYIMAGGYEDAYRVPLYSLVRGLGPFGKQVCFIWMEDDKPVRQMVLPEGYIAVNQMLYDSATGYIYVDCVKISGGLYAYAILCMDTEGTVLWERVPKYRVYGMALLPVEGQNHLLVLGGSMHRTYGRLPYENRAVVLSEDKMARFYDEAREECASAFFLITPDGEPTDYVPVRDHFIRNFSVNGEVIVGNSYSYAELPRKGRKFDYDKIAAATDATYGVWCYNRVTGDEWLVSLPAELERPGDVATDGSYVYCIANHVELYRHPESVLRFDLQGGLVDQFEGHFPSLYQPVSLSDKVYGCDIESPGGSIDQYGYLQDGVHTVCFTLKLPFGNTFYALNAGNAYLEEDMQVSVLYIIEYRDPDTNKQQTKLYKLLLWDPVPADE